MSDGVGRRSVKSYVLRGGRISNRQERALQTLCEHYCIPFRSEQIDLFEFFGVNSVVAEIGFGMGHATAQVAAENPDTGYLGIEVFRAGVGNLLAELHERGLKNVRIVRHDAAEVLKDMVPDESLAGVHVFFPDPWPKKKHHKRRLLNEAFLGLLATKLATRGYLYAVTDWEEYAESILAALTKAKELHNPYGGFAPRADWRPATSFERKACSSRRTVFEIFARRR